MLTTELITVLLEERDVGLARLEGCVRVLKGLIEVLGNDLLHRQRGWGPASSLDTTVKERLRAFRAGARGNVLCTILR